MHRSIFFFVVVMLVTIPSVEAGVMNTTEFIINWLGREYWDGDWSVADKIGNPVKNVKSSGHIRGWIDIVGFRNMSVIDGVCYVNGTPASFAIVKRDAWHTTVDGVVVSFTSTSSVDDHYNYTTAAQHTIFHWKYEVCPLLGPCYWVHVWEYLTVSYTVDSPKTFTTRIPDVCVYIKSHNRTVAPVTYIYVPVENHSSMEDVMISRVCYNGSTVSRHDQVGWVMKNNRGTEHVEFVDDGKHPSWCKDDDQSEIDHCGRLVTIFDPDFNMSLLNISLHTPYETRYVTNYSTDIVTSHVKINIPLLKVIMLLVGSFMVIILIVKVIKRVL